MRPGFRESEEGLPEIYNGVMGRVTGFGRGGRPGRDGSWGRYSFGLLLVDGSMDGACS